MSSAGRISTINSRKQKSSKKGQIWIAGIVILVAIIGVVAFFSFSNTENQNIATDQETDSEKTQGETKEFDMIARNWEFAPETIEVNKGDEVILNVESVDVRHGISIPEYGINKDLPPGEKTQIKFTADKKGTFSFRCSVHCGRGHSSMTGQLVVK